MSEFGPVVSGDWLAAHLPEVLHEIRQRFRPAVTEIPEEDVGRLAEQLDVLAQGLRGPCGDRRGRERSGGDGAPERLKPIFTQRVRPYFQANW